MEVVGSEETTVKDNLPPEVFIVVPELNPVTIKQPDLEIRAVAKRRSEKPVKAMRLMVDGRPYEGEKGRKSIPPSVPGGQLPREARQSWTVILSPGEHMLSVVAESEASSGSSDPLIVTVESSQPTKPRLYILAVGVSAYPDRLKLDFAAKDAEALVKRLEVKAAPLFEKVETRLVIDAKASQGGIYQGLNWLRSKARTMSDQDVVVLFYSGHGVVDDAGDFYFVPSDVNPENMFETAVNGNDLKNALAGMRARVLFLLDACHAGAVDRDRPGKLKRAITDDLVPDLRREEYGVITLCSSTGTEVSLENRELGQGNFTTALIEALDGLADMNKDGEVLTTELITYVTNRVIELTGKAQHPVASLPSIKPFALTRP